MVDDLFRHMNQRGWYSVSNAQQNKISQVASKFQPATGGQNYGRQPGFNGGQRQQQTGYQPAQQGVGTTTFETATMGQTGQAAQQGAQAQQAGQIGEQSASHQAEQEGPQNQEQSTQQYGNTTFEMATLGQTGGQMQGAQQQQQQQQQQKYQPSAISQMMNQVPGQRGLDQEGQPQT